ncbi:MAG TPA: glycosyltransferase family 2 protein [Jatrophihabitantaceae bacterium]|nr:glycosyltransferase family 2 protein [Jatrophihabitantaceae bacterium]
MGNSRLRHVDVSVIIPAKDEEQTILPLVGEIVSSMAIRPELTYEIIFVDDGSTDATWAAIEKVPATYDAIIFRAVRFRTNFGKAAALAAGFQDAAGDILVTLDADMQDDPAEIPRMLDELDAGYDLVTGYKAERQDPLRKRVPSKLFNRITGFVTGLRLRDHNSGLRVGRREVYEFIPLYGELHRYVPALGHASGFRVTEVAVNHRPRLHGRSKYGMERYGRGALDLLTVVSITRYGRRPSHLLGGFGLIFGLIGTAILVYLSGVKIFGGESIGTRPLLQLGILLEVLAVQLIGLGLLAELIIHRTDRSVTVRTPVRARLESNPPADDAPGAG